MGVNVCVCVVLINVVYIVVVNSIVTSYSVYYTSDRAINKRVGQWAQFIDDFTARISDYMSNNNFSNLSIPAYQSINFGANNGMVYGLSDLRSLPGDIFRVHFFRSSRGRVPIMKLIGTRRLVNFRMHLSNTLFKYDLTLKNVKNIDSILKGSIEFLLPRWYLNVTVKCIKVQENGTYIPVLYALFFNKFANYELKNMTIHKPGELSSSATPHATTIPFHGNPNPSSNHPLDIELLHDELDLTRNETTTIKSITNDLSFYKHAINKLLLSRIASHIEPHIREKIRRCIEQLFRSQLDSAMLPALNLML